MQRIYLVRQDGSVSNVHMPYDLALAKLRAGELEEVYEIPGIIESFLGVRLRDSPLTITEHFHRGSTFDSDCCLTEKDALGNVGALSENANSVAMARVSDWPFSHDDLAVVISAGKVYGASLA